MLEKKKRNLLIGGIIFLVLISLGGFALSIFNTIALNKKLNPVVSGSNSTTQSDVESTTVFTAKDLELAMQMDPPSLGNPDAKLTLIEFADFQCPFCKKFFDEGQEQLLKNYIDTGKVRLIHLDFPFLGEESTNAAIAARCAQSQGKFWEYHDLLYKNQKGENLGEFSRTNLVNFASQLKLDKQTFSACLNDVNVKNKVNDSSDFATKYGVKATPTFFIQDQIVVGGLKTKVFSVIDEVLSSGATK